MGFVGGGGGGVWHEVNVCKAHPCGVSKKIERNSEHYFMIPTTVLLGYAIGGLLRGRKGVCKKILAYNFFVMLFKH